MTDTGAPPDDTPLACRFDSYDIDKLAWLTAGIDSSRYAGARMVGVPRFPRRRELEAFCLAQSPSQGLVLEFGVWSGTTINRIAAQVAPRIAHGFDSFEGLPEDWREGYEKGVFARTALPEVADTVALHVGWFDRTLPGFLDAHPGPAAFIHMDCDLYSSTQTVLSQLRDRIVPGTVIMFDEYFNYPGWQQHEYRAFAEFVAARGLHYDYIGLVPVHQQVAVRIVG